MHTLNGDIAQLTRQPAQVKPKRVFSLYHNRTRVGAAHAQIAYVRNKKSTLDLKKHLSKIDYGEWHESMNYPFSLHSRCWTYNRADYGKGFEPGSIQLYHLWLPCFGQKK